MLSFADNSYWRYGSVRTSEIRATPLATELRRDTARDGERVLAASGTRVVAQSIPPNLSALWLVPSLGGYVSLEDRRFADLTGMDAMGEIPLGTDDGEMLDALATRFVVAPSVADVPVPVSQAFAGDDRVGFIGADALTLRKTLTYDYPPNAATSIVLVSALGRSAAIPNDAVIADLDVSDGRTTIVLPVRAGGDTAESAYDRPDIRPTMRHRKARVYSETAGAALYVATFALPKHDDVRRVEIRWRYRSGVSALTVAHLVLVDDAKQLAYRPLTYPRSWRARRVLGAQTLFENPNALPGAWAVGATIPLDNPTQVQALREGSFGDPARAFDPRAEASVPASVRGFDAGAGARGDRAFALSSEPMRSRIDAQCAGRCLVIVNGLWYPGWHASVDGVRVPIVRADDVLRGVDVGPGHHTIEMWFAPDSLALGIAVASVSAAGLLAMCALAARRTRRASADRSVA